MTRTGYSRRDLLKALLPLAVFPQLKGMRLKITDVRLVRLRLVKELGSYIDFNGRPRSYRLGGNSYVEVHTDQGLVGIGPGLNESLVEGFKNQLVGKDPFDIEHHAARLNSGRQRGGASVEVALWDLIGKAANQPLYKLWGGVKDRIKPYASLMALSTPRGSRRTRRRFQSARLACDQVPQPLSGNA